MDVLRQPPPALLSAAIPTGPRLRALTAERPAPSPRPQAKGTADGSSLDAARRKDIAFTLDALSALAQLLSKVPSTPALQPLNEVLAPLPHFIEQEIRHHQKVLETGKLPEGPRPPASLRPAALAMVARALAALEHTDGKREWWRIDGASQAARDELAIALGRALYGPAFRASSHSRHAASAVSESSLRFPRRNAS